MTRDPLLVKIYESLDRGVDPSLFERCASDLLRQAYPSLSPVQGGSDCGFDGAIGTEDGPFPLICTVSPDFLANVRKNVESYLTSGAGPRTAVFATPRPVTPQSQRKIRSLGNELGVTIVNIHEKEWFANALYKNARWRRELLGITGDPPALSALPINARPWSEVPLIGREVELDRIRAHVGDLLVIGVPGSGKTYLHQTLAKEGRCLFATSKDLGRIADDLRTLEPPCLVVDDAHVSVDFVRSLVHLRRELGGRFSIHANCWPGHHEVVVDALGLSQSAVLKLDLLGRDVMVEVFKACSVYGPDVLLNFLLDQAEGKPGLGVALIEACKRGDTGGLDGRGNRRLAVGRTTACEK